jgi:thiopeptide-type bacteriocin biosynthesis protein
MSWWFLRLVEPDHHLRLRLRLPTPHQFGDAAARLAAWTNRLTDAGVFGGLHLDTYRPEIGRFGHGPALQAAETVFAADSAAALAQLTLAASDTVTRTGQAITAASMLDLAAAFSPTSDEARQWLIDNAPRTLATAAGRELRTRAIDLAARGHRSLAGLPGGERVLAAWDRRRTALSAYRATLLDAGIEPQIVLADLLHLHHARVAGPHLDRERTCLHLARAAALSQNARIGRAGQAA